MIVSIMQPTYLPWVGYLAMIDRVDHFVLFDSVAFNSRSWQQRNYIKSGGDSQMLSVPVLTKGRSGQIIQDVSISPGSEFPAKHIKSIELNYKSCPYFEKYAQDFFDCYSASDRSLSRLNCRIITWLCEVLGIRTPISLSSELEVVGRKAELLAGICSVLGADRYLSAPGSKAYIDDSSAFDERAISVFYHNYNHPVYDQKGDGFVPYLASIDLLFNVGADAALDVIRSGVVES